MTDIAKKAQTTMPMTLIAFGFLFAAIGTAIATLGLLGGAVLAISIGTAIIGTGAVFSFVGAFMYFVRR
jgi:hypothetical protein